MFVFCCWPMISTGWLEPIKFSYDTSAFQLLSTWYSSSIMMLCATIWHIHMISSPHRPRRHRRASMIWYCHTNIVEEGRGEKICVYREVVCHFVSISRRCWWPYLPINNWFGRLFTYLWSKRASQIYNKSIHTSTNKTYRKLIPFLFCFSFFFFIDRRVL